MLKKYKAIFFDWDGTAVMSRRAPVDQAVAAMRPLLQKGIKAGQLLKISQAEKLKVILQRKS